MKKKLLKSLLGSCLAAALALACAAVTDATVPYSVSWVGNTWEQAGTTPIHMQYQILGIYVASDGTVYTNSFYDEAGQDGGIYKAGNLVGSVTKMGGSGRNGGYAVASDGTYLYMTMTQRSDAINNAANTSPTAYPPYWTATNSTAYQSGDTVIHLTTFPTGLRVGDAILDAPGIPDRTTIIAVDTAASTITLSRPVNKGYNSGQSFKFNRIWQVIRRYTATGTNMGNPAPFSGGWGYDGSMLYLNSVDSLTGAAVKGTQLYVSDTSSNGHIKVIDTTTMTVQSSFSLTDPGAITIDATGNLWIVQNENSIVNYTPAGTNLSHTITSTSAAAPVSVWIDGTGRLLVADNGPDQQIKIFTNLTVANPTPSSTFGAKGGFKSGTPGIVSDLKFQGLAGVGTDSAGNIYVACNEFDNFYDLLSGGSELKSFTAAGATNWKLYGLQFENIGDFDPYTSGADIQTTDGHYKMDYAQAAGQQWTYFGFSLDPYTYPHDVRMNASPTTVLLRRVNGNKIQYGLDQGIGSMYIHRFSGEEAIPAGVLASTHINPKYGLPQLQWPPNQPAAGAWIWRDVNGDGLMDASEYILADQNVNDNPRLADPASKSWWVDDNGDIWTAYIGSTGIRRFYFQGFDTYGNPTYSRVGSASTLYSPLPAPFNVGGDIARMQYDAESDTMYLSGYNSTNPNDTGWGGVGKLLARYNQWSSGTPVLAYTITLPWTPAPDSKNSVFVSSFAVSGEKIFAGDCKSASIGVYSALTGILQQTLSPAGESSQLDANRSLNSIETNGGQYLVLANENLHGKNYLYQVGGNVSVATYNANDSSNTLGGSATPTANPNLTSVTHLSNTGSVTFNSVTTTAAGFYQLRIDGANGDNAKRVISISVNGAAPTALTCPGTKSWSTFMPLWTTVTLNNGANAIKLYGNGVNAPDIAHLAVMPSQ